MLDKESYLQVKSKRGIVIGENDHQSGLCSCTILHLSVKQR